MMKILFLCVIALSLSVFGSEKVIGGFSTILRGNIDNGLMYSHQLKRNKPEIRNQLKYMVGQLNEFGHGIDFTRVEVRIKKKTKLNDGSGLYRITYRASFEVSFDEDYETPETMKIFVPSNGSESGRTAFFDRYAETCRKDRFPSPMSLLNFWYRFRMHKEDCPILKEEEEDQLSSLWLEVRLTERLSQDMTKSPEYKKIWEDNTLVSTMVFGKSKEDGVGEGDAGIRAYNEMYQSLLDQYGEPVHANIDTSISFPNEDNPYIEMFFELGNGRELKVYLFLTAAIKYEDDDFIDRFQKTTYESDFVSYNGHAGLGGNIDVFGRLGDIKKGKYQVYFANGCTTYSYMKDILANRHSEVNDGAPASRTLDIITNATPSYFSRNAENNMSFLAAFIDESLNYKQILRTLDHRQGPVVSGEQDNE